MRSQDFSKGMFTRLKLNQNEVYRRDTINMLRCASVIHSEDHTQTSSSHSGRLNKQISDARSVRVNYKRNLHPRDMSVHGRLEVQKRMVQFYGSETFILTPYFHRPSHEDRSLGWMPRVRSMIRTSSDRVSTIPTITDTF
jgi:hypothetical protein